jgi:hypothetical protein
VPKGVSAYWDPDGRQLLCVSCGEPESTAGGSARREHERRSAKRERDVREAHPHLGGLILAITDEPQSTRAWTVGAEGEEAIGAMLEGLASDRIVTLHDRRVPGTRANIDHIVIAPTGIHIVDTKRYKGLVELRDVGGWFRRDDRLFIKGRDRTNLADGLGNQVVVVRRALGDLSAVDLHAVLCFVGAEWNWFAQPFEIRGVTVLWPKELRKRVTQDGALSSSEVDEIARRLRAELPPR